MVELEKKGRRSVNRNRRENYETRMLKKYGAKKNWFKGRKNEGGEEQSYSKRRKEGEKEKREGSDVEVEAVMFVPATPGGELTRLLQEADDRAREGTRQGKVKFVERGGGTVKDMLCRNNPWEKMRCGREKCMSCPGSKEGGGGECRQENVVYRITCLKCKGTGVLAEYWGETARTAYERGEEHVTGLEAKNKDNSLWKHSSLHHGGS